jgi:hypothetical protein
MAANKKSTGKRGATNAVTRELERLKKRVRELTPRLEREAKARKLEAGLTAAAKKAQTQLTGQIKTLGAQGRRLASKLKSAVLESTKRQQLHQKALATIAGLKTELARKTTELKRKSQELGKPANESAHRAATIVRGEGQPAATEKAPKLPKDADQLGRAIARWENEGGAPKSGDRLRSSKTMAHVCSVLLIDHDNEGNNQVTVRCQLAKGHSGKHRRSFTKLGKHGQQGEVVIEWDRNIEDSEDPDEHEIGGEG